MEKNSLSINALKDIMRHIINNNRILQESGKKITSMEIIGEAGLGKTAVVEQIAKEFDVNFVKLSLSQIEELGDLVGMPVRQFELCKDEKCVWVDEYAIQSYEKEGYTFTGQKRSTYCPPEWMVGKSEGGILLLDDYSRAEQRFLQACMELIDKQEYISWKLPKDWHIILTSNPDNGEYYVNPLDTAQKTRYMSFSMQYNEKDWAQWAEGEGIDGRCINFMLKYPEVVTNKTNPRSLVTFFNSISSIKDFDKSLPLISILGEGSITPEATQLFIEFINNKLDKLIGPEEIAHKDYAALKPILQDIIGVPNLGTYRADLASILCTRFINYSLKYSEANPIKDTYIDRIEKLIVDELFGADLGLHLVTIIAKNNKFRAITGRGNIAKLVIL